MKNTDYIKIATSILKTIEVWYMYATAKATNKQDAIKELTLKLVKNKTEGKINDIGLLSWWEALNNYSWDYPERPPTFSQIIKYIRKVSLKNTPKLDLKAPTQEEKFNNSEKDYQKNIINSWYKSNFIEKIPEYIKKKAAEYKMSDECMKLNKENLSNIKKLHHKNREITPLLNNNKKIQNNT